MFPRRWLADERGFFIFINLKTIILNEKVKNIKEQILSLRSL